MAVINNWLPLKAPFNQEGQSWLYSTLEKNRLKLLQEVNKNKNKVNLIKIENMLNNIFYAPTKANSQALVSQFQEDLKEETSKAIERIMEDFNFDVAATRGAYNAKERVQVSTLQNTIIETQSYIKDMERAMKKLDASTQEYQTLANLQTQIQSIVSRAQLELDRAIENYGLHNGLGKRQFSKVDVASRGIMDIMHQMTAFNKAVNKGKNLNQKAIGDLFEAALEQAFKNYYDGSVANVLKVFETSITGAERVARGNKANYSNQNSSYTIKIDSDLNTQELKNQGFKIDRQNVKATYSYDPRKDTQGKMDVLIEFETDQQSNPFEQFRISAKNWIGGSNSLGKTSIDAALVRSVGENIASYYKLAVLSPAVDKFRGMDKQGNTIRAGVWNSVQAAHSLARLSLASDIIMGLNQGQAGMANVLIVNTGTLIKVFDIAKLVREVDKQNGLAKLTYKEAEVQNSAINEYKKIQLQPGQGRSNRYYATFTSTLNKMKIGCNLIF